MNPERARFIAFRAPLLNACGDLKRPLDMDEIRHQNGLLCAVAKAERGFMGHSDDCQFMMDVQVGWDSPSSCTCGYDTWKDQLFRQAGGLNYQT